VFVVADRFHAWHIDAVSGRRPSHYQGLPGSQGRPWWSPRSGKQLDLFAERTSAATLRANQLRLWFASFAHALLEALRRIGLRHTQFATATCFPGSQGRPWWSPRSGKPSGSSS
jgi:hypothetical protein